MHVAKAFSELGIGVIALGLVVIASLAGAETAQPLPQLGAEPAVSSHEPSAAAVAETPTSQAAPGPSRFATPVIAPVATSPPPQETPATAVPAPTVMETGPSVTAVAVPSPTPPPAEPPTTQATLAAPSTSAPPAAVAEPATAAVTAVVAAEQAPGGTPGLKPAKVLFGAVTSPAPLAARAIGTYARGCLSGGQALPVDGPTWQAMRLSRNRNWGHPKLIALIQKLAADGKAKDDWPGLLVGDLAQPRGGPMLSGHASHQIGLDADIWLTPMPPRTLSNQERETIEATSMLSEDGMAVAREHWTDAHLKIIKRAASYPEVERVLINPAIKQVLCTTAGTDRAWLSKVRPYWGHHYHMHIRIGCPAGSTECAPQKGVPGDDGCGKELEDWLKLIAKIKPDPVPLPIPAPDVAAKPAKEKPSLTLDKLPSQCQVVLATGNPDAARDIAAAAKATAHPQTAAAKHLGHKPLAGAAAKAGSTPPKAAPAAKSAEKKTSG